MANWFTKLATNMLNVETEITPMPDWYKSEAPRVSMQGASSGYDYVGMYDGAVQWGENAIAPADTMTSIIEAVKASLGYVDNPLTKCRHCGQWGAVYCACAHCGAPVDPE